MDRATLAALELDGLEFRRQRNARLATPALPLHALASAIYMMAAAKQPGSATHRHLTQAADVISELSDREGR